MRITEPYTIFARTLASGKVVYYYQFRNEDGRRSGARSTGCTTLSQARRFCQKLYNSGELSQDSSKLFRNFAEHFFDKDKEFYRWRVANLQPITDSTLTSYIRLLNNQLLPYFAKIPLGKINTDLIKKWIIWCTENWSAKTTNNAQSVLNIVLKSAQEKGLIKTVPSERISFRKVSKKERNLLTIEEIRNIYKSDLWFENTDRFAFLLIAITGLREGECVGLKPENVKSNYLDIKYNYHPKFKLGDTKTKYARFVPVPDDFGLLQISGKDWVFERNGSPVPAHTIYMTLRRICDELGIAREERGITLHSLRDFYNSYLRSKNISDAKIKAVIGHKDSKNMTDWYTYWTPEMFTEIYEVQKELYHEIIRSE